MCTLPAKREIALAPQPPPPHFLDVIGDMPSVGSTIKSLVKARMVLHVFVGIIG